MPTRSYIILGCILLPQLAFGQLQRPRPYPVIPIPSFEAAIQNGTRTATGLPGPDYWSNRAAYEVHALVSPETATLRGRSRATYFNESPYDLHRVYVHLRQNLNSPGAVRNRPQELSGGIHLSEVDFESQPLIERQNGVGYSVDGTVMEIRLPEPIEAGKSADFDFAWSFVIPKSGAPRMGQDAEVFYLGYWYPQFAVYDDVRGWVAEPYMGDGEFYMGFADYDVRITVPEGYLVGATGTLQNPEEVLSDQTLARYREVTSDRTYSLVGPDERDPGTSTVRSRTGSLTWHYTADRVRDFAFGTSDRYVWDATLANVGVRDQDGAEDTALIHALYRPTKAAWTRSAEFGRYSVEYLSDMLIPYPYPHMTVVEGIIRGGMEYPMITLIGGSRSERSLFGTTFHEISHMWLPMTVAHDEKHYAWMDEGLTSFNTNEGVVDFWNEDAWNPDVQSYYRVAGTAGEVEPMRHADRYPVGTSARTIASYNKPAVALHALRHILGDEVFSDAYREYVRRWAFKHPYPYDLFNTFEDVAGRDLDWFWTSLFYETWTLDQAVSDVEATREGVVVTVEDLGLTPMPVPVTLTYADGGTAVQTVPVEHWLDGRRTVQLHFERGTPARVEIDPGLHLPDVDRGNNIWMSGSH